MRALKNSLKGWLLLSLLAMLSACSQSRYSMLAGTQNDKLWEEQPLCEVNIAGYARMGCFGIQVSPKQNTAYIYVDELLFNPGTVPYRVLARPYAQSNFQLMADNVSITAGGTIQVKAKSGVYIEDYEEWRIELTRAKDASNLNLVPVAAGQGLPVVQSFVYWTELDE